MFDPDHANTDGEVAQALAGEGVDDVERPGLGLVVGGGARARRRPVLVINPIVFAEISVGFDGVEDLEDALPPELYRRDPVPYEAAFLAGKSFLAYRRRGGRRATALPDFYIGAHAAVAGHHLLTRDPRRYRTYFPRLVLIAP